MERDRFENWLRNIYDTQDEEISCSECFDRVSAYVELEAAGQDAAARLPMVSQHLGQCRACRDEYETLRAVLRMEDEGGLPSAGDLQGRIG